MSGPLNASRTLAIVCGASSWPNIPQYGAAAAFKNTAGNIRECLTIALRLPGQNICWLFDEPNVTAQYEQIDSFIRERSNELNTPHGLGLLITYWYVGHANFFGPQKRDYCLLVSDTRKPLEAETSLKVDTLAHLLRTAAPDSKRILILDCCFAASAAAAFFQSAVADVAALRSGDAIKNDRGVSILCASSAREPARLDSVDSTTLFGGALTKLLLEGDAKAGPALSLRDLCRLIDQRLVNETNPVYPQVHSPQQSGADLADLPLFPNLSTQKLEAPDRDELEDTTRLLHGVNVSAVGSKEELIGGDNPHGFLGAHPIGDNRTMVRTLRHHANTVTLLTGGKEIPLAATRGGVFTAVLQGSVGDYRIRVDYGPGAVYEVDDPYRWQPTLGDVDLHLIGEGRHENLFDVLGAHIRTYDTPSGTVMGTSFAVWAPSARGVRVTGDFDHWSGADTPMRSLGSSGVWELFVPGVGEGTRYKFQILGQDGVWREKADPMAFAAEIPPATASMVTQPRHEWNDADWMQTRAWTDQLNGPLSIYEIHAGSWREGLNYRQLADALIVELAETEFTHVEFLPLAGHPFPPSLGYQVTSYYAPDSRLGSPDDLRYLVDQLHQAGIGVIIDWVPAHFPKDDWALGRFDGTALYEHADPRRGEHPDRGTFMFDFGRREVRNFLVANALYWLEQYHIDGLRVNALESMLYLDYSREDGQWLPNIYGGNENLDAVAFLQETNATVGKRVPGALMIAEESTGWPGVTRPTHLGGLGFHLNWNLGWTHNSLKYISRDPADRLRHHEEMTGPLTYAFSEQFVLPISHDEVVDGKGSVWSKIPGDERRKAGTLRTLLAHQWAHPGKQLLFMGQELGNPEEWNHVTQSPRQLRNSRLHNGIRSLVGDLNRVYKSRPALYTQDFTPVGFTWIDARDEEGRMLAYLRWGSEGSVVACILNFSESLHRAYRIGLPFTGMWREAVDTDSEVYGGYGGGNNTAVIAEDYPSHGQPASAKITLTPFSALWLVPEM